MDTKRYLCLDFWPKYHKAYKNQLAKTPQRFSCNVYANTRKNETNNYKQNNQNIFLITVIR